MEWSFSTAASDIDFGGAGTRPIINFGTTTFSTSGTTVTYSQPFTTGGPFFGPVIMGINSPTDVEITDSTESGFVCTATTLGVSITASWIAISN